MEEECGNPHSLCFQDFDGKPAVSGAVELAEIDGLPGAEHELPILDEHKIGWPEGRRFNMGVGIPFPVSVVEVLGDKPVQRVEDVPLDGWIGSFIYGDGGGSVRHEKEANAVLDTAVVDLLLDLLGHIDELDTGFALDVDIPYHAVLRWITGFFFFEKSNIVS